MFQKDFYVYCYFLEFINGAFEKRRETVVNRSFLRGWRRRRRPQQLWKRSGASIHFKCPWRPRPRRAAAAAEGLWRRRSGQRERESGKVYRLQVGREGERVPSVCFFCLGPS